MRPNRVFLDMDGVVNTVILHKHKHPFRKYIRLKDGNYVDLCLPGQKRVSNKQAVLWLNKICNEGDADIVITSSWRIGHSLDDIKKALYRSGLDRKIKIIGATKVLGRRDAEILQWISSHYCDRYVVLDDDDFDLADVKQNLVRADTNVGLTYNEYKKAVEILTEKN